jgi:hypothetical protein
MGEVAGGTALLSRFMNDLLFVILFFVTLEASLIPFCLQQMTELGGMRVMALTAFTSLQSGMDIGFIHPDLISTVARIADFISFFLQNQFRYQTMSEMTILTLFLFHREVDIFHHEIFVSKFLVAVEAVFAYKPFSSRRSAPQRPFLRRLGTRI